MFATTSLSDIKNMKHPVGINNAITAFIDGECHIFADTGSGSMSTTVHNTYDAYGNLASYKETATNYELDADIAYHDLQSKYIVPVPKHIAVKDKRGKVYRERSADINSLGDITSITMHNCDKPSVYDMTYDAYGNLTSLTKPENHKGQRMRYDYTYDDVPMLETRVTDALGRHAESYTDEKGRNRETVQHASGDNITVTKNRFTKHYFIGDKRIASKLGTGKFSNVYGISGNNVTAGQKDYAARMMQIEKQREEYYKSLGTPPGVPTMKGATADPDNTGRGYNDIIGDLGDHSVPEGWVQRPKFNDKGDVPGPPIQWQKPEDPDNAQPGYGYIPTDTTNVEDIFFYHSDHLGSTSYITDAKANITQFDAYLPYGELLVDEHTSSEDMPYKFNGKELDQETGLYYYGARYMNPVTSLWCGVDKLTEKYTNISGILYCHDNPIIRIDPDGNADYFNIYGKFITSANSKDQNIYIRTSNGNILLTKYNFSKNLRAAMRIVYHYASSLGVTEKAKSVGVQLVKPTRDNMETYGVTTADNRVRMYLIGGYFKSDIYQIYNFKSSVAHEGFHVEIPNHDDEEVRVILKEMNGKEFSKTTSSFQNGTIGYFQNEFVKLYKNNYRLWKKVIEDPITKKMLNKYNMNFKYTNGGNDISFK